MSIVKERLLIKRIKLFGETALRGIRLRSKHIQLGMFTMKGLRKKLLELSLTGQMKLICFYRFEIDFALSFQTVLSSFLQSAEQDFASEQKQISMI